MLKEGGGFVRGVLCLSLARHGRVLLLARRDGFQLFLPGCAPLLALLLHPSHPASVWNSIDLLFHLTVNGHRPAPPIAKPELAYLFIWSVQWFHYVPNHLLHFFFSLLHSSKDTSSFISGHVSLLAEGGGSRGDVFYETLFSPLVLIMFFFVMVIGFYLCLLGLFLNTALLLPSSASEDFLSVFAKVLR